MPKNLVSAYLAQTEIYYSDSTTDMIHIAGMVRAHAGNAAAKMLRECTAWAEDARVAPKDATLWMTAQPLFRALVNRAGY